MGYLLVTSKLGRIWVRFFDHKQHPDTAWDAAFSAVIKVSYQFVSLSYYKAETFCVFGSTCEWLKYGNEDQRSKKS